jgi:uncharacterized protein YdeI (YjbR/CyaY-like superfamily)
METVFCHDLKAWRTWLKSRHASEKEIWLVFLKGKDADQDLSYDEALDEALCWGWIDSLIKRIDDSRYARKFTPRKPVSKWSEVNKRRVVELEKLGRMKPAGTAVVAAARANGSWDRPDRPTTTEPPPALVAALNGNRAARAFFDGLAPSHKARYMMWIYDARKEETRQKRAGEAVRMLEKGMKLGI